MLIGRSAEREQLAGMVAGARQGRSGVLVITGEPGAGKTALLCDARDGALGSGMVVLRANGIESETSLAFAGVHELLRPLLGRLEEIPPGQADALRSALRLAPAAEVDRFAVSAGVLSLLVLAAEHTPLLVLVD